VLELPAQEIGGDRDHEETITGRCRFSSSRSSLRCKRPKEATVQYMLLIYDDEQVRGAMSEAERGRVFQEYGAFTESIRESGNYVTGAPLQPTSTATAVRVRKGEQFVTNGPFAETKEQLGGYYLIEAENVDEAIEIASRIPSAKLGTIEVRPVLEIHVEAGA